FGKYYRIKIQEGRKGGTWQNGGYLKIIPDIVVYNENEKEVVVIDTKYKKMPSKEKSNLPSNDFYQIYTYCRFYKNEGYENVKGVLLYPQHIQEESKENAITIEKDKISIYFRKIDLSMLKERDWKDELVKNLKQVFKNLNGGV
ncbi:MAG: hypothetical protein QXN71_03455, partial [Candidatus Aenigmatarchaeota archaeon]